MAFESARKGLDGCRPVVILSDRPKEEMDRELKKGLASYDLEWHTRTGMPYSISDLDKVAAGSAQTVLLLQDDTVEVDLGQLPCGSLSPCYTSNLS